jgi:alkylation response protein AidB-like acyl-CoA dehydrogenase
MSFELTDEEQLLIVAVRNFSEKVVRPLTKQHEEADSYPAPVLEEMKRLGLFGLVIPQEYGGLGQRYVTYALVFEEISRVWMSIAGILGTHSIASYIIEHYGTDDQKKRWLNRMSRGDLRCALALTEPRAGSDLKSIKTTYRLTANGTSYVISGSKMFITNADSGTAILVLARDFESTTTEPSFSAFLIEKDETAKGLEIAGHVKKLGYRGVDTCEVLLKDVLVPKQNLVGEATGDGLKQVLSGLELGRINVAARAVGVARAAMEDAIRYSQERIAFGKPIKEFEAIQFLLADMSTQIDAAKLLTLKAAELKWAGKRCDLESGEAKLFASEMCAKVTLDAMRIHGGYGYTKDLNLERYYRDAPLMIIGEGTNEIQRLVIARNLLKRYESAT